MKRKKLQKVVSKVVSVLLCTAMSLSMIACGNTDKGNGSEIVDSEAGSTSADTENAASQEVVEITLYPSMSAGGTQDVAWQDEWYRENLGIVVKNRLSGDGVLESMIASGELTDVIMFQDVTKRKTAIEAGLLLDLSQYKEKLPNVFENDIYATALAYEMDTYGGVYGLPSFVGEAAGFESVPDFRWDAYKGVGYPAIEDMDGLLDVLKQMQEAYPESPTGEKTYGIGIFPSWDYGYVFNTDELYFGLLGYDVIGNVSTIRADYSTEPEYMLADNSIYYEALKFFFKANQMGILDPDSPTLTWDEYNARANALKYMFVFKNWFRASNDNEAGIGYKSLLADAFTLAKTPDTLVNSNGWRFCVSANTEQLDATLKFIDWIYSYEGQEYLKNGPEGMLWEYNEDGVRVMTEEYEAARNEGKNHADIFEEGHWNYVIENVMDIMLDTAINPNTGTYVDLELQYPIWGTGQLNEDWYDYYGQITMAQYAEEWDGEGTGSSVIQVSPAAAFLPAISDEMSELFKSFAPIMNTASWKMIFAEDEAEFEELWVQLQKDAEAMGIEQVHEDTIERRKIALDTLEKYSK